MGEKKSPADCGGAAGGAGCGVLGGVRERRWRDGRWL